ncbi:hypothetical protein LEMLEM_LOCUS21121, partial [Lemmus lemmus]
FPEIETFYPEEKLLKQEGKQQRNYGKSLKLTRFTRLLLARACSNPVF